MNVELIEMNVTLSDDQKERVRRAFEKREDIRLMITKDALRGRDTLLVPLMIYKENDDLPNGTDATMDKETHIEMWEEFSSNVLEIFYDFDDFDDFEYLEYFGIPFSVAIDESFEGKGIEFYLNYKLLNNLTQVHVIYTRKITSLYKWKEKYMK